MVFTFGQYTSITQVDSAVDGVTLMNGTCSAGVALSKCHNDLFAGISRRPRALLVVIAGRSFDGVSSGAASLKLKGVKITVIGIGGGVVHSQLADMAYPSSYVLTSPSFDHLDAIAGYACSVCPPGGDFLTLTFCVSDDANECNLTLEALDDVMYIKSMQVYILKYLCIWSISKDLFSLE